MNYVRQAIPIALVAWLALACAPAPSAPSGPAAAPAPAAAGAAAQLPAAQLPAAQAAGAAAGAAPAGNATGPAPSGQSATGGATVARPLDPPQKLRVATIGIAAEAPIFLALDQGYFRELGLDIELVKLAGGADTAAMLTSDQLDVGALTINPGAYNLVARGVGIRLVGDRGSTIPGRSTPSLAIRTGILERKPWSGYQDLRGLRIATVETLGISDFQIERMLQRGGLQPSDIEIVSPLLFPDMAVAFANEGIDAAMYNEPWATQQEQQGIVKKVVYADDVDPNGHVATLVYGETFARNTPAARNYMVGWLRGVRDYWDGYDGRKDFQPVLDVIQKYTALKDEALIRKVPPTGQSPVGYLDVATLERYQDWLAERGAIPHKADIEKAYDPSFAEYANSVLGPYQPVENPRRPG